MLFKKVSVVIVNIIMCMLGNKMLILDDGKIQKAIVSNLFQHVRLSKPSNNFFK